VAWSPDGTRLALGWSQNYEQSDQFVPLAVILDAATGQCLQKLKLIDSEGLYDRVPGCLGVAWSRDGRRLATRIRGEPVRIWDAVTGRCVKTLEGSGPAHDSESGRLSIPLLGWL